MPAREITYRELKCEKCMQEKMQIAATQQFFPQKIDVFCGRCGVRTSWKVETNSEAELKSIPADQATLLAT